MELSDLHVLYRCRHGSRAYGTNLPTSDEDVKGIVAPKDISYFFSPFKNFEQYERKSPDLVYYNLNKFFKLAADCNPNIIEVLFVDESDVLENSPIGIMIRSQRDIFLSKKIKYAFSGYAHSQAKRIRNHKRWIDNPPINPERVNYGLPAENGLLSHDQIIAIDKALGFDKDEPPARDHRDVVFAYLKNTMEPSSAAAKADAYMKEKRYRLAAREFESYTNWQKNRNKDRHALEQQFQYDTKHANHLIRLQRMCKEVLETGKVLVKRPDAEELLSIRHGAWSYDKLLEESDNLEKECDRLYKESNILPSKVNQHKVEDLLMECVRALYHDVL